MAYIVGRDSTETGGAVTLTAAKLAELAKGTAWAPPPAAGVPGKQKKEGRVARGKTKKKPVAACLGCGWLLRRRDRFCESCGKPNRHYPGFRGRPGAAGKPAARLQVVKSADEARRDAAMAEFYAEPDPARASHLWAMAHPELKPPEGAA